MTKTQTIKNKIKEMRVLIDENIIDPVITIKLENLQILIDRYCRIEMVKKNMTREEYNEIMDEIRW